MNEPNSDLHGHEARSGLAHDKAALKERLTPVLISQVLSQLVAQKVTSVREIADVTQRGESTVYRWLSGQSEPEFSEMVTLMRSVSSSKVRKRLVDTFTKELPVRVHWLNDDATLSHSAKDQDHHDAVDLAVLAMASLVRVLVTQRPALRGKELDEQAKAETIELIEVAERHLDNCRAALEAQPGRKKAKPLSKPS